MLCFGQCCSVNRNGRALKEASLRTVCRHLSGTGLIPQSLLEAPDHFRGGHGLGLGATVGDGLLGQSLDASLHTG
jgi:hypothetical protein